MKLFDVSGVEGRRDCIDQLRDGSAFDVTPEGAGSIVLAARRLEESLAALEGAIFMDGPSRLSIVIKGAPDALHSAAASHGCKAAPADLAAALLAAERPLESRKKAPSTLSALRSGRKENVMMIVDDDAFTCMTLQNALKRFGECVVHSAAGPALDAYLEKAPDCVFLDLHLDNESGLDVIDRLRKYDSDAYIVMLTADSGARHAAAAKSKGAKSFLAKPLVMTRVEYELSQCPTFRRYGS